MNFSKTAQLLITFITFLIILFIFSSVDLALTLAIAVYLLFSEVNFSIVFIVSLILFIIGIIINYTGIDIRFLSDLTTDAYILFVLGVGLYLKSRKDFLSIIKRFWKNNSDRLSRNIVLSLTGSMMFTLLIFPIVGQYPASIFGYLFFSFLLKKFNGKIAVAISLFFLFLSAVFLILKNNYIAETLANYTYLFLVLGTVQEVINLIRRKKTDDINSSEKNDEQLHVGINFNLPGFNFSNLNPRIVFVIILISMLSFFLYYSYPILSKYKFFSSMPKIDFTKKASVPTLTSASTIMPSFLPTWSPTPSVKVTTLSAQLKILVLNGTKITGLAASTSAKLKAAGFRNVLVGDAKSRDYKTWEVTLKKHDGDLAGILKNVLELETDIVKEATDGAKFDIEIIVGINK